MKTRFATSLFFDEPDAAVRPTREHPVSTFTVTEDEDGLIVVRVGGEVLRMTPRAASGLVRGLRMAAERVEPPPYECRVYEGIMEVYFGE